MDAPRYEARVWPVYLFEPHRAPSADEYVGDSIVELWTKDVGKSSAGPLALGDSVIMAAAADKRVTMLRREDGAVVWQRRLKGVGTSGVLFTHTRAYAASGDLEGQLHAWDLLTGKRRWNQRVGPVQRPIALREGTLYAGTTVGAVVALGIDRGTLRWQTFFRRPVRSGVTVLDDLLFVASEDSLFLLDPTSGAVAVGVPAPGVIRQPPAVHGATLVIVSPDRLIAGFDVTTLEPLWQLDIDAPILGGVSIARDTAYATTLSGDLWRIPLAAPRAASRLALDRTIRSTPAPVRNGVLLGTVGGEVLFVDSRSGSPRWSRVVDGPIEFPPIVDQGTIFVYDGRGTIHAWASVMPDGPNASSEHGADR